MSLHTSDTGSEIVVTTDGVDIARYVYRPDSAVAEGPKPYLHPLRTLDGAVVTGYRPWDHRWHKGLQMTWTHVSGENFWGGPTFDREHGYVLRENVGSMIHDSFAPFDPPADAVGFTENLTWRTQAGHDWMHETRTHVFGGIDRARGLWVLDFATTMRNIHDEPLELGSPTTQGRPAAGYTGFFLRMPRAWTGGDVLAPGSPDVDAVMGAEHPWVAFSGPHDERDGGGTVLAFAGTSSAPVPIRWFVRSEPFPVLSPSPSFDEHIVLAPGDDLALTHRYVFGDRQWSPDEAAEFARLLAPEETS